MSPINREQRSCRSSSVSSIRGANSRMLVIGLSPVEHVITLLRDAVFPHPTLHQLRLPLCARSAIQRVRAVNSLTVTRPEPLRAVLAHERAVMQAVRADRRLDGIDEGG